MGILFTAAEILSATGGRLMRGDPSRAVSGVSIDSRTIRSGELFIAIKGERFDGHQFIYDALGGGANGVLVSVSAHRIPKTVEEEGLLREKILIGVTDTLAALQELSRFHRRRWTLPVVGISGSNGKTTTKEMVAAILGERFVTLKNEGNINNRIGVPLTLLRMRSSHQAAVLEMGISRPGELRRLCEIALPQVGLITNIGPAHLETFGTIEAVAAAKAELLEALSPTEGLGILNRDDPFYSMLRSRTSGRVVTFGSNPESDVRVEDATEAGGPGAIRLHCRPGIFGLARTRERSGRGDPAIKKPNRFDRREVRIHLPVIGRHNAMNAAAAAAAALTLGCELEEVSRGLERFQPVAMRLELITWEGRTILNDAYNANPASMQAALETLSRFTAGGRRIAVLGDMLELGADAVEAHRRIGAAAVSYGTGFLISMGRYAAEVAEGARAAGMGGDRVAVCREPVEAAETLRRVAEPGDIVLIKGSRGMRMERILDHLSIKR